MFAAAKLKPEATWKKNYTKIFNVGWSVERNLFRNRKVSLKIFLLTLLNVFAVVVFSRKSFNQETHEASNQRVRVR